MTVYFRAGLLALVVALVTSVSLPAFAQCTKGYYRFTDSQTATGWKAANRDYNGQAPHGISVFEDLSSDAYKAMAEARNTEMNKSKTFVFRVPCSAPETGNLFYAASPTNANNWTQAGGALHGVIGVNGASTANDFNSEQVNGQDAPDFLSGEAVLVIRVPPAQ